MKTQNTRKVIGIAVLTFMTVSSATLAASDVQRGVYQFRHDISTHPDEARRLIHPPTFESLGERPHFTFTRDLNRPTPEVKKIIARFKEIGLGDVVNPACDFLKQSNQDEVLKLIKENGFYLYDIWGYCPGNGDKCPWPQFTISKGMLEKFERELGDHWLGMDTGEQDGRWTWGFKGGGARSREEAYGRFQEFFECLHRELGNRMCLVMSLNYAHYFLRENCYTTISCESAQALPNNQIYFAFIRGAGKQYGVPWASNVSFYNQWGFKSYPTRESVKTGLVSDKKGYFGENSGPWHGASLSLMKRLLYANLFYGAIFHAFEGGLVWNDNSRGEDALMPIGRLQHDAMRWFEKNGNPGVMQTPVAVVTPFGSGWSFARHFYWFKPYMCWGKFPYGYDDFFIHGVLGMLYPNYQESGFFHDETGFNTPTPYGDIADCLLSDTPLWLLKRYPLVVLAGNFKHSQEFADTLVAYVKGGGHLVMTEGTAKRVFKKKALHEVPCSQQMTLIPGEHGVEQKPKCEMPKDAIWLNETKCHADKVLPNPYPLTRQAWRVLDKAFRNAALFTTGDEDGKDGLSLVTTRRGKGDYTLLVCNNTWQEKPLHINSKVGRVVSIEELTIPSPERIVAGYCPSVVTNTMRLGADSARTIAAGAVRAFRVAVEEESVREIAKEIPPSNPRNRYLSIGWPESIRRAILRRPTFFRHWDGVLIDWRYVYNRDDEALREEVNFIRLQGLKVMVDFRQGLDLYPHFRMDDRHSLECARSKAAFVRLIGKCSVLGVKTILLGGHRAVENGKEAQLYEREFFDNLKAFCQMAAKQGIEVRLQGGLHGELRDSKDSHWFAGHVLKNVAESNLKRAVQVETGEGDFVVMSATIPSKLLPVGEETLLAPLTRVRDPYLRARVATAVARGATLVFDAAYADLDEEYADAKFVETILPSAANGQ